MPGSQEVLQKGLLLLSSLTPTDFIIIVIIILAAPHGMQDLSSPTRDQNPEVEAWSLNH